MLNNALLKINLKSKAFLLVILSSAIVALTATDVYIPSLPQIALVYGNSIKLAQYTVTLYMLGLGISQLFYGQLSDAYGRRKLIIIGISLYLIGSLFCYFSRNIELLLLGRLLQGLGMGAPYALSGIILSDIYSGNELAKKLSYLSMALCLSPALAPAVGGIIEQYTGYKGNFFLLLVLGSISLVLSLLYLAETNKNKYRINYKTIVQNYRVNLTSPTYLIWLLIGGLALACVIAYSQMNPFIFINQLGYLPSSYGYLTFIMALGLVTGSWINGKLVTRFGMYKMVKIASMILMLAGIGLLVSSLLNFTTGLEIVALIFLATIGIAIVFPNSYASALEAAVNGKGAAGSLYGASQVLISMLISGLVGSINTPSIMIVAVVFLLTGLLNLIILPYVRKRLTAFVATNFN